MSVTTYYTGQAIILIVVIGICSLMALLGHIFLGVAVYHNAKAHNKQNAGMWCALTILFGYIPAIIYLATRKSEQNRLMICPHCQATHPVGFANCPQCGVHNVYSDAFTSPYAQQQAASSKRFLIASIILQAMAIIGIIVCAVLLGIAMVDFYGGSYHYGYHSWY